MQKIQKARFLFWKNVQLAQRKSGKRKYKKINVAKWVEILSYCDIIVT